MPNKEASLSESFIYNSVKRTIDCYPLVDIHTHLYPPSMAPLALFGINKLLGYHYITAELKRVCPSLCLSEFSKQSEDAQADFVWRKLFVERTPLSEATRGVVTVLKLLGLDPNAERLDEVREFYLSLDPEQLTNLLFKKAGIRALYMTNDPLDPVEQAVWRNGVELDPRFRPVLRIDSALLNWPQPKNALEQLGYQCSADASASETIVELQRYLREWCKKIEGKYLAISLPPEFGEDQQSQKLLAQTAFVVARELGLPVAMMIGVRRGVNPKLGMAGDGNGHTDLRWLEQIAGENEDLKFLITLLSREDQHSLCVTARKFSNIIPFGCWWFLNNPSLIEEMTRMRLDMLGTTFIPQHSDARVLEQLLYKWEHSRSIIAKVLSERYIELSRTGFAVTESKIERDIAMFFDGRALESPNELRQ